MSELRFSLQDSLNRNAKKRALDAIAQQGKALPCSVVSISGPQVTINFETLTNLPQVTVPRFGSAYVQEPVQVGDYGFVMPLDANLLGVAGIGGVADIGDPSNLVALVFFPVASAKFPAANAQNLTLTGVVDVMLRNPNHQITVEGENTGWLNLISQLNALLLVIGPLLTTSTVLKPILATTNPVVART